MKHPALAVSIKNCEGCSDIGIPTKGGDNLLTSIITSLLFIVGLLAVSAIVVCGIRLITSDGDVSKVKSAKAGIGYAILGLIIAMTAYTIVNFVIGGASGKTN